MLLFVWEFLYIFEHVGRCVHPLNLEIGQLRPVSFANGFDTFVAYWIFGYVQVSEVSEALTSK